MNALQRLFLLSVTFVVLHGTALSAREKSSDSFLQIQHVGAEDKPVCTLIFTTDVAIAAKFKDSLVVESFLLDPMSYRKIDSFFAEKFKSKDWSSIAKGKIKDFGTFEISNECDGKTVPSYRFVIFRDAAVEIFRELEVYLVKEKIDAGSLSAIRELIRTVEPSESTRQP